MVLVELMILTETSFKTFKVNSKNKEENNKRNRNHMLHLPSISCLYNINIYIDSKNKILLLSSNHSSKIDPWSS